MPSSFSNLCHGNEQSLRVRPQDMGWYWAIVAYRLRIGPRGGIYWKSVVQIDNPDSHRHYVPGSNRTKYAEDRPFPKLRFCVDCGFIFECGWEARWDYETEFSVMGIGSTERTNMDRDYQ